MTSGKDRFDDGGEVRVINKLYLSVACSRPLSLSNPLALRCYFSGRVRLTFLKAYPVPMTAIVPPTTSGTT